MQNISAKYELPLWESQWHAAETQKFRFMCDNDQTISEIDCLGVYGIKSFRVHTNDGAKADVGFVEGGNYASKGSLKLSQEENLIRIRDNKFEVSTIELVTGEGKKKKSEVVDPVQCGNWLEYKLKSSEKIIGVFGETFTDDTTKMLKSLGFI